MRKNNCIVGGVLCNNYRHQPSHGVWCAVYGETYRRVQAGDLPKSSEVTLSNSDSGVCGEFENGEIVEEW